MAAKKITVKDFKINKLLTEIVEMGASDVHIIADEAPYVRINGDIQKLEDYKV